MVKVSSGDILAILRRFNVANDDNRLRQITMINRHAPTAVSTLASFLFDRQAYHILFDDTVDDDIELVLEQLRPLKPEIQGELITNPLEEVPTYALPFKGKDVYLFKERPLKSRLDVVLGRRYPDISRSSWQKYVKAGYVSVNGAVVKSARQEVSDSDDIAVSVPEPETHDDKELPILYVDDNVIVVDKPAGLLTHSKGVLSEEFTVADFFERYSTYHQDSNRPGIVHRLDRDTSGVIIGARHDEAATLLQKQFASRKAKKTYIAIVVGTPKKAQALIDLPIGRNPAHPSRFRVDPKGKSAQTSYEVLASRGGFSLVKLEPKTGRTHQLRVHMQYIGTPMLGDRIYGKPSDRLYLHARSLEITIPGGERKLFSSVLPQEFKDRFNEADVLL